MPRCSGRDSGSTAAIGWRCHARPGSCSAIGHRRCGWSSTTVGSTTRALAISIANGPYAGLGFTVAPDARLDDGRFDIRIFRGFSRWHLVRHFASIVAGRRAVERRIETYRSARVRVSSRSPLPVRPDDDPPLTTPVSLDVLAQCLRVVVPEDERGTP